MVAKPATATSPGIDRSSRCTRRRRRQAIESDRHSTAVGRSSALSNSSGRRAGKAIRRARRGRWTRRCLQPQGSGQGGDGALGLAVRRGLHCPRTARRVESHRAYGQGALHTLLNAELVVEHHLAGGQDSRQCVADRHDRELACDRGPAAGRPDRDHDQPVDAGDELAPARARAPAAPRRRRARSAGAVELALDGAQWKASASRSRQGCRPAGRSRRSRRRRAPARSDRPRSRARRRPRGRAPRSRRNPLPAERVAHGGGREPRVLGKLAQRGVMPFHPAQATRVDMPPPPGA